MESPSAFTSTSMRPNVASTESTARSNLVRLGHVGDDGNNASSGRRRDLGRRALHVLRRQRIERDIGTGLGEHLGDASADAASGPGDEDDFPGDVEFRRHHDASSIVHPRWTVRAPHPTVANW